MKQFLAVLALGMTVLLGGCATVTTGTTQSINIDSDPQAAECTLTREGAALGTVTTPSPLTIKRHAATVHVVCRKSGYEDGRSVMNSRFETASAGNFLVGGIIGVMVDASSGANSRYDTHVMVRLTPMSPADQAAAATRAPAAPAPQPVVAAPAPQPVAAAAPPPAAPTFTGPWKSTGVLVLERSASICARVGVTYAFDLSGDTLKVDSPTGPAFTTTVPADGALRQTFKAPNGTTFEMIGNARTRDLEVLNNFTGCRWKYAPDA
jgi:hypothetical protein